MRDCWPFSSEAQLKNDPAPSSAVAHAPPHHSNQSVKLYNQMFPRGNFGKLELRSSRDLPGLCVQVHMCDVYTAMLCSYSALRLNRPPGEGEFIFFSPCLRLFASLRHLRLLVAGGVGASVSNTSHRCTLHWPKLWCHINTHIIPFFLHPTFPRSSALCWVVLTSSPSMRYGSSSHARK